MDDISGVGRIEFVLGRGQTAILPSQGKSGKDRRGKSPKDERGEDEFHLHGDPMEDTAESLDRDRVDLEI
jgi:hypothetical protein